MTIDISEDAENLELFHYGIKGMKWGVRRKDGPDGTVSSGLKKKSSPRAQRRAEKTAEVNRQVDEYRKTRRENSSAKRIEKRVDRQKAMIDNVSKPTTEEARQVTRNRSRVKKHGTDSLTNKELKDAVERMNLEQQYANLQNNGKAAQARRSGQQYVADIAKDIAKELLVSAIKSGVSNRSGGGSRRSGGSTTTTAYRVATNQIAPSRKRIGR